MAITRSPGPNIYSEPLTIQTAVLTTRFLLLSYSISSFPPNGLR